MENKFSNYGKMVRFLGEALGENYRVAFYAAGDPERPLLVSGRDLDDGEAAVSAGLMADILSSVELKKLDFFCSTAVFRKTTGKKHSVFYVRDEAGEIAGFLCIFEKESGGITVRDVFNQILENNNDEKETSEISRNIGEEIENLIDEHIQLVWNKHTEGKEKLSKDEKIDFIRELFDSGLFRMKGAAEQVSKITGISLTSVYRYFGQVLEE